MLTTVTSSDDDDPTQTVTYTLSGGADDAFFDLDTNTGELTFKVAPDLESTREASTHITYTNAVTATDDGTGNLTDVETMTVTVQPLNDNNPAITSGLPAAGTGGNRLLGVLIPVVGRVIWGIAIVGVASHRGRSGNKSETKEQGKNGERMYFHVCLGFSSYRPCKRSIRF